MIWGRKLTRRRRRVQLNRPRATRQRPPMVQELRDDPKPTQALLALVSTALVVAIALHDGAVVAWDMRLGLASMLVFALGLLALYIASFEKALLRRRGRLAALALGFVLVLAVARALDLSGQSFLWAPVAILAMVWAMIYDPGLALMGAFAAAFSVGLMGGAARVSAGVPFDFALFITLLGGGCVAAFSVMRVRERSQILKVGLMVGICQFALVLGCRAMAGSLEGLPGGFDLEQLKSLRGLLREPGLVLLSGLVQGFLLYHLLPLLERAFDVTSSASLQRWADINHPFLKRFSLEAPGTYHHSMMVATLAEAAADAIKADGLLCRVGAYYHDIGKLNKPEYFFENTMGRPSRHLKLSPAMSALIIMAHPKDGAEMAEDLGLPGRVVDFIREHHGTTLVEYFFHEARQRALTDPDSAEVEPVHYRYPGPRPGSRETAILMVADSVEATTRTLSEPTAARIETVVSEIIQRKLEDGQFDHAPITFADLSAVREAFVRRLTAIYHSRIRYPGQGSDGSLGGGGAEGDGAEEEGEDHGAPS